MDTKTNTGLTKEQNELASFILDKVHKSEGDYTLTNNSLFYFKLQIDKDSELNDIDSTKIIKHLEVDNWIVPDKTEEKNFKHKISDWAWIELNNRGSFMSHYEVKQEQQEKRKNSDKLDTEIKEKTLENLNRSIFKQKHAIWFFLANFIVTVGVALLTAYLIFKFGWK